MTLVDVINLFDTDEKCRELLVRLRWPNAVECPRCKMPAVDLATTKQLFYCKGCDYQFSVTSGTVFNDSHLALQKWFLATLLLCEAKKGMSANQIKRTLGVSYKTAWYLCHRIRFAMTEVHKMLDGTIEVDETYIGGKAKGKGTGNYRDSKEVVIGIIQRSGDLKFVHVKEGTSKAIRAVMEEHVSEDVDVIVTDESVLYASGLPKSQRSKRKAVNHKAEEYVRYENGFMVTTNTVESAFSLFKRGIVGSWHRVSPKHLAAYLNEMTFRFNRRKSHTLFLDTLRHMVTAPVLTFERLTA
ncbi:MAG TPA: IS1595 family transposase [Candidatus Sulfotelmatobacter sp.]|nr:IS1595 family transposase [Candidatus Sulfotelmatobacter sp.]